MLKPETFDTETPELRQDLQAEHEIPDSMLTPRFQARMEFWVRFLFGALWGAFMSIAVAFRWHHRPTRMAISIVVLILGCGFAAARMGDNFWRNVAFRRRF